MTTTTAAAQRAENCRTELCDVCGMSPEGVMVRGHRRVEVEED